MTSRLRVASIISAVLLTSAGALYAQDRIAPRMSGQTLPGVSAPSAQCATGARGILGY